MREFLDPDAAPGDTLQASYTAAYAEYEFPLGDGGALICYLTAEDERWRLWSVGTPTACSFIVKACIDELLSPYAKYMQDSIHGAQWTDVFFTAFPTLQQLYADSEANRFADGGLRWVLDPDVSENKFMVIVEVDDVAWDADNWANPYKIDRIRHGLARSLERSLALAREINENFVSAFARAAKLGLIDRDATKITGSERYLAMMDAVGKIKSWSEFIGTFVG